MMANVFVNYDVETKHVEVKQAMINKGYHKTWTANGTIVYLPNTSVWKKDISAATGLEDIKAVCKSLDVKLIRAVALEFNTWDAIQGEDFK